MFVNSFTTVINAVSPRSSALPCPSTSIPEGAYCEEVVAEGCTPLDTDDMTPGTITITW